MLEKLEAEIFRTYDLLDETTDEEERKRLKKRIHELVEMATALRFSF